VATPGAEEPPAETRWSARKKADAVVRLLRGESLDELSRELRVEAHRLQAWRDEFLAGGIEGLKAKPLSVENRRLKDAERKIGELTMENEVLRAAARKRHLCMSSVHEEILPEIDA
jgi:transposase